MKLLEKYDTTRTVKYFGISIEIPFDHQYIAADSYGDLFSYKNNPSPSKEFKEWVDLALGSSCSVGVVDLEGQDWFSTLVHFPL